MPRVRVCAKKQARVCAKKQAHRDRENANNEVQRRVLKHTEGSWRATLRLESGRTMTALENTRHGR